MGSDRPNRKLLVDLLGVFAGLLLSALTLGAWYVLLYALWGNFGQRDEDGAGFFLLVVGSWIAALIACLANVCVRFPERGIYWAAGCLLSIPVAPFLTGHLGILLGTAVGFGGQLLWMRLALAGDKDVPLNICMACGHGRTGLPRCPECGSP